jgi:uncharacterized membrane protein YqgA involved in biofilm formation
METEMIGLGTLANMVAILFGSAIGLLFQGVLKQRFQTTIMNALGLAVMFVGISGALQGLLVVNGDGLETANMTRMIVSLAIGAFFGELIDIEARLDHMGEWIKSTLKVKGEKGQNFVEGFVSSSLLFCIGAMAIIGSLQDGLSGNASMLFAKSIIDGTVAIFIASTLGIGVIFSIIPLGIYQGGITLSAKYIEPYLSEQMIANLSFIGSILIFGIGINMVFGKKIKCGNLLPAVLVPVICELITRLL